MVYVKMPIIIRFLALCTIVAMVFVSLVGTGTAASGVVGEWHFDGNAQDSGGNSNHGTIKGAIFDTGKSGQALSFNGKNQNVIIPDSPDVDITGPFSIELWIKLASKVADQPNVYPMIIEKGDGTWSRRNYGLYLDTREDLLIFNAAKNDKSAYAFNVEARAGRYLDDLNWHKISATWDGNSARLSIDDVEVKSVPWSGNLYTNSNPLTIGGDGIYWFNGLIDEVKLSIGTSVTPTPQYTQTKESKFSAESETPANVQSSTEILKSAITYKILLDSNVSIVDSINNDQYYIVKYDNILPYASGIEVFSSDGKRVGKLENARPIFSSIGWRDAASQVKSSDIQTLREIQQTSQKIDNAVTPVVSATSYTLDKISWAKGKCVSALGIKKCIWDVIESAFPGIDTLSSKLQNLDTDLKEWKSSSSDAGQHIPNVISGLEQAKSGGQVDSNLQNEITVSMSAFGTLQTKTDRMSEKLSSISSELSSAESSIRSKSGIPVLGSLIKEFADAIGSMKDKVLSLKRDADSFSRSMSEQSAKLSAVTETANKKKSELEGQWNARQNAETKVYGTIGGIGILILLITLIFLRKRKASAGKENKDEVKENKKD